MCIFIISILMLLMLAPFCGATDIHFHKKPEENKIRVACVGDSITNGALIPGCFFRSYPVQLQKMLGHAYHVENFGLNDRTLQASGNKPYCKEKEFYRSIDFNPDIIVVLLGTNDTKPVNWDSQERFISEYKSFLKSYESINNNRSILICTPPWARDATGPISRLTNDTSAKQIPQIVESVNTVGQDLSLPVIDLYSEFEGKTYLLSYDGVHPNNRGAKVIAGLVKDAVMKL